MANINSTQIPPFTQTEYAEFTQEELKWITAPPKSDDIKEEIIFIKEDILVFHRRQTEVWEARLRWLEGQESEAK